MEVHPELTFMQTKPRETSYVRHCLHALFPGFHSSLGPNHLIQCFKAIAALFDDFVCQQLGHTTASYKDAAGIRAEQKAHIMAKVETRALFLACRF
jgi:hypothetical protein